MFPWLWDRLQRRLVESKEDTNAAAVDTALKAGPKARVGGAAAKPTSPEPPPAKSDPPTNATPGAPTKGKGKGKDKGKGKAKSEAKSKSTSEMSTAEKAKTPCIFQYSKSGCRAGKDCVFKHTDNPPPAKHPPKGPPAKAPVPASIALLAGLNNSQSNGSSSSGLVALVKANELNRSDATVCA